MTINNAKILLYCALIEICYLGLSLKLATVFGQWSVVGEAVRIVLRLLVIAVFVVFYRRYFATLPRDNFPAQKPTVLYLILISLLMSFAVLFTNASNETFTWQAVFAASGLLAGIREELFYRGMLQHYFETKSTRWFALVAASALFTLSHIQYLFFGQFAGLLFIGCAGVIFGCVYLYSRSIVQTCLIHGIYDALLSINIVPFRLSNNFAQGAIVLMTLFFIFLINKQLNKNNQRTIIDSAL